MSAANGAILDYVDSLAEGSGADFRIICGGKPA
jgi:hypothetical protein